MARETDQYGTVMQAAKSALFDIGEDDSRLQQFLHWGLEGARDWRMDMNKSVKTKQLTMTDYKSIVLPKDCVDWSRVGIKSGNIIKTFTKDNNIALHFDTEDGERLINSNDPDMEANDIWELPVSADPVYFYGYDTPMYGLAYKDNGLGYYREHEESGEIQLRTNLPLSTKIYLEYISDGWDPNAQTLIKPTAFKMIKLYIHWMNLKYKRMAGAKHVSANDVFEAKQEYWDEFDRVSWREFDLSLEDIQEAQRQAYMGSIQN